MKRILLVFLLLICSGFSTLSADEVLRNRTDFLIDISSEIDYILEHYYGDIDEQTLRKGLLDGMHKAIDPWTNSYSELEYKKFVDKLSGEFVGLGVYVEKSGDHVLITEVIEGGAAEKAGLKSGDRIYAVDQKSIAKLDMDQVVSLLSGKKDSPVSLQIMRKGASVKETLRLLRKPFVIKSVKHYLLEGIDVIQIDQFGERTYSEFLEAMQKVDPGKGFLLDLRDNPGGYLDSARQIADELLPKDLVITIVQDKHKRTFLNSAKEGRKGKLIVLINEKTASASEILASALQDHKRAVLVGDKSFGKGLIQQLGSFGGRYIKLTIGEYKSPKGSVINGIGVLPDYRVSPEQELFALHSEFKPLLSYTEWKYGAQHDELIGIKQRLRYLGYKLQLHPNFDRELLQLVNRFKKENNLKEDGMIDEAFKLALDREVKRKAGETAREKQLKKAIELMKESN